MLKSHIMPRGVYNRVRDAGATKESDLVKVQPVDGTSLLTSRQIVQRLFCRECEDLFKVGEDYFYSLVDAKESEKISLCRHVQEEGGGAVSAQQAAALVDIEQLASFALGIFWRSNVSTAYDVRSYIGSMGRNFEEEVRKYLVSEGPFPSKCLLIVTVYDGVHEGGFSPFLFSTPVASRITYDGQKLWSHSFFCLGLEFTVVRGGYEGFWGKIIYPLPKIPMVLSSERFSESKVADKIVDFVHNTSAVGVLQKMLPSV